MTILGQHIREIRDPVTSDFLVKKKQLLLYEVVETGVLLLQVSIPSGKNNFRNFIMAQKKKSSYYSSLTRKSVRGIEKIMKLQKKFLLCTYILMIHQSVYICTSKIRDKLA